MLHYNTQYNQNGYADECISVILCTTRYIKYQLKINMEKHKIYVEIISEI